MQRDGGPGGGAGGLGSGGSFTGPAEALEILGDHAYAYSGVLDIDNNETNMLSFTTGNYYFVGTIQWQYIEPQGETFLYKFYLNNGQVGGFVWDSGATQPENPPTTMLNIIIPAYTVVRATALNNQDTASREQLCMIVGRIYRG